MVCFWFLSADEMKQPVTVTQLAHSRAETEIESSLLPTTHGLLKPSEAEVASGPDFHERTPPLMVGVSSQEKASVETQDALVPEVQLTAPPEPPRGVFKLFRLLAHGRVSLALQPGL